MPTINYELVGIVIHSGQANAGHYYSLIKDTQYRHSTNGNQWYRFNDATVDKIQLTEQMLEEECFGGKFRTQKDTNNNTREERIRFWNAYMLFYERVDSQAHGCSISKLPPNNKLLEKYSQMEQYSFNLIIHFSAPS